MKAYHGYSPYPGFTIGPAKVVSSWGELMAIGTLNMPAIIVAPYLETRMVDNIAMQRVYGIVLEHGSFVDPICDELKTTKRPSIIGAAGLYQDAEDGDLVAIDGEEHLAVLKPEGDVLDYYRAKKGLKCHREPGTVMSVLDRFVDVIRTARLGRGWQLPLDLAEGESLRILGIARKVSLGQAPTKADDEFIRRIVEALPPRDEDEEGGPAPPPPGMIEGEVVHDHDHEHDHEHCDEHPPDSNGH